MESKKQRVLFIVPLPPPVHGSSMISQYIKDSKLINETFDCDFVNLSTSRRMDEIGKRGLSKLWRMTSSFLKTIYLLLTHRYDRCFISITCHGVGFLKDAPFALLCKLFGHKLILHQENKGMSRDVDKWPYRWLLPLVYKNSQVVLLSWLLYPDIEKVVKREQVVICPNCATPIQIEINRDYNKEPRILYLGNMIVSKGVLFLLDALEILQKENVTFHCDFVGNETEELSQESFLSEVKKRGLSECVEYLGPKVGEEKSQVFLLAGIFVFPTFYHNECFPLVLLEAMQYGLPIVTTDEGAIADIVKDGVNGLVCKKGNPRSLADGIFMLLRNGNLRNTLGQASYKKYKMEYSIQTFERNIIEILQRT